MRDKVHAYASVFAIGMIIMFGFMIMSGISRMERDLEFSIYQMRDEIETLEKRVEFLESNKKNWAQRLLYVWD